jgi:hypothetical protein
MEAFRDSLLGYSLPTKGFVVRTEEKGHSHKGQRSGDHQQGRHGRSDPVLGLHPLVAVLQWGEKRTKIAGL